LLQQLDEGLRPGHRLTLVSAPAGFGKTTLLVNWIQQTNCPVAWLSLDQGDNDPTRFWVYVIAALQTVQADIGQAQLTALQSPQPPPIEDALIGLVNEIADTDSDWLLVCDDFHVITEPAVNHGLFFLLEHLPPNLHLLLATRADPPWPLARLRVRGAMTELRTEDLRFTLDETATFLNAIMGLDLSVQDIAVLDARTEGWIAGLHLAALSMQGQDSRAFVQTFGASHRFVLDYLVEEVLDRQSPEIQTFLLETSILERLTAPLCDAVRDKTAGEQEKIGDSQAILEHLDRANLFVIPLDDVRRWYRYHRLFADLLHTRLKQMGSDHVAAMHLRASRWYEAQGVIAEAVAHALAAGDVAHLAHLVEHRALTMIYHGELRTLIGWLRTLPDDVMGAYPWLGVAYAWALAYAGDLEAAESVLRETAVSEEPERARLVGHFAAIRGYCAMLRGDTAYATQRAREALRHLPEKEQGARGFVMMILGTILAAGGDAPMGAQLLSQALAASRAGGDDLLEIMARCELAVLKVRQGQLHDAAAMSQEALRLSEIYAVRSGQPPPAAGFAHIRLATVLHEWNALEAAIDHAEQATGLFTRWGQKDGLLIARIHLAALREAVGDLDGALAMIQEAQQLANELTWYASLTASFEVWLHLAWGAGSPASLQMASRWVQENRAAIEGDLDVDNAPATLQWARILIALGRAQVTLPGMDPPLEGALRLLARLLPLVETADSVRYVIKALILQAMALQDVGQHDQAQTVLWRALALGEPEGYTWSFVNEGEPMQRLLVALSRQRSSTSPASATVSRDYLHKLLGAFSTASSGQSGDEPSVRLVRPDYETLIDPLSDRELEVLRLLRTDLTSTEIAETLYISKNTVRSHIKHIYDKLDVHSREEAVQRAQALGLL
jgi:LuxR family maltose regulon positive regulatory protein